MKRLRILCGFLCALCVEFTASAGVVLDAPGHVVVEGEATTVRGGEPGAAFTIVDWLGWAVDGAGGVFGNDGAAALPPLPTGYYRIVAVDAGGDSKRTTASLAVVSPPSRGAGGAAPRRLSAPGGFLAADTGPIWPTARGEAFLCPWNGGDAQRTLADLIWLCGIRHVRDRLSPGAVMQKPDSFGGSYFLRNAELFAERGIGVCDTYSDAPAWTALRKKMPTDLAALRGMCERLAAEFGGRMEAWEFWNEPDIGFAPGPVWDYAAAMKAAYLGYKAGRRDAVALSGALCTSPGSPYWETLFANDAAKFTDAFNFHTYAPIAAYKGRFAEVRRFMEKNGMGDRALWLTEVGTEAEGVATDKSAMPQFKAHTPEQELVVAEVCPKALMSLQMEGVARAYWFIFGAYGERDGAKDWGMLRRDGTVKPVFASLATIVRELGNSRLLGELDAGKSARAYLYEQPDGSQTVAFWAESPVDTVTGECHSAAPVPPVTVRLPLPESTASAPGDTPRRRFRLSDMCGTVSTVTSADGVLALEATRFPQYVSGLSGLAALKPAIQPGRLGTPAQEPDEDLSVIVRVELDEDDWSITRNKTRAVPRRGDGGRLRVVVWNLGDTAKTGTVEVAGGHLAGLPARPFALGPRGTPPVAFDCAFQPLDDGVFDPSLVLRGVFNGKRGSRICVPVWLEERFFAGCEETPLEWRNIDAWRRNDSAGRSMVSWDESEEALRFDWEWLDGKGRWAYPYYHLADGETLAGARVLSFEVKSSQDKLENDFSRAYVMLGGGELPFQPPNGNWERRYVELPAQGLEAVREFRLGANPNGRKVRFWLRNISIMRPAEDINPASAGSLPAAAQTRPEAASPYGVCAHLTAGERDERPRTLDAARAVGAGMVRCDFWWSDIERPDGSFDFSLTDAVVADAKAAGITILPILGNGHPRHGAPFEDEAPWRRYVHAVAERYAADCPVFEVWNEPDVAPSGRGCQNPTNYVAVLKAAAEEIRAAAPGARIASGGTAGVSTARVWAYIGNVLSLGGGDWFDIINVHAYSTPSAPEKQYSGFGSFPRRLRALMTLSGYGEKHIWNTEFGWPTNETDPEWPTDDKEFLNGKVGVDEESQAIWTARALGCAFAEGVALMMPYELRDRGGSPFDRESRFGLLHEDFSPKPAFYAYKTFTAMRPAGSAQKEGAYFDGGFFFPQWTRPDGEPAGMLWTTGAPDTRTLRFVAGTERSPHPHFFNHLGQELFPDKNADGYAIPVSDAPIYFVAAELASP